MTVLGIERDPFQQVTVDWLTADRAAGGRGEALRYNYIDGAPPSLEELLTQVTPAFFDAIGFGAICGLSAVLCCTCTLFGINMLGTLFGTYVHG